MSSAMDIFNQPPAVSEDTLRYTLYPPQHLSDKASVITLAAVIKDHVDSLLPGHIWHRDGFELKVISNPYSDGWTLEGRMRVGDSVDDEWCVVWLLKEISSQWDVMISVVDSDGEFLLIEAAESLPSWVSPSTAENRVWIYSSQLHLVPLAHVSAPSSKHSRAQYPNLRGSDEEVDIIDVHSEEFLAVNDAIGLVRDQTVETRAPFNAERTIWQRIADYPAAARQHVHRTKVYLPVDIARTLIVNPFLVQKAVETFYTRDALQLRAVHRMSRFPPNPSVLSTVKMTRTAYAQLVGQKFYPPKIFGRWSEREDTKEWRHKDIGMKIACGFEMIYQESKSRSHNSAEFTDLTFSAEARKDALRRNPDYTKYMENLASTGYFKGEIQGSHKWIALEDKAANAFIDIRKDDDASRTSFAAAVNAALAQSSSVSPLPTHDTEEEDSDDWLTIDAEGFETMLENTLGSSTKTHQVPSDAMEVDPGAQDAEEDRIAKEQASKLQDLAKKVEEFVEGKGNLEGAQFEDEHSTDEEFSEDDGMNSDDSDSSEDEERPEDVRAARKAALDMLVPAIDPSEYGKMPPSYHSNSQRVAPVPVDSDVGDSSNIAESSSPTIEKRKPIRQPILPRDKYDGVDSDDETDEEADQDSESEEEKPQVVGEIEIDMEEEEEEFLEFARQQLGMSNEQWSDIIREREGRGAFVPAHTVTDIKPPEIETHGMNTAMPQKGRMPAPGPRPNVNPNLDSFEAVMQAMDVELARSRKGKRDVPSPQRNLNAEGKGKNKATVQEDDDIEAAMDAELRAAMEGEDDNEETGEESIDYNLIKNFLESFRSQDGLAGPVGNLAGRLQPEWKLPRDVQ